MATPTGTPKIVPKVFTVELEDNTVDRNDLLDRTAAIVRDEDVPARVYGHACGQIEAAPTGMAPRA